MARPRNKTTRRGVGACGTLQCTEPKEPGHFLCAGHLNEVGQVKEKLDEEAEERSLYLRRSENKERKVVTGNGRKKAPRQPTCCWLGCYEPRSPGTTYCGFHAEEVREEMNEELDSE